MKQTVAVPLTTELPWGRVDQLASGDVVLIMNDVVVNRDRTVALIMSPSQARRLVSAINTRLAGKP